MTPVDGAAGDAWVFSFFEVIKEFFAQSGLGFGEGKRTREVVHLIFFRQLVDRRSFMELAPVATDIALTKIIDEEENDVGSAFGRKV